MKKTKPCPTLRADLKAYMDNELTLVQRLRVRAHLHRCADCRNEVLEMKKITDLLRGSEAATPALAPALRSRVLSRLETVAPIEEAAVIAPPQAPALWRRQPLLVFGGGGVAVAASALVFATMYGPAARESARSASLDKARQVGTAFHMYGQDYDAQYYYDEHFPTSSQPAARHLEIARGRKAADLNNVEALPATAAAAPSMARAMPMAEPMANAETTARSDYGQPARRVKATDAAASLAFVVPERQVHKEAALGVQVAGLEAASDKIEQMVKTSGGFVASNNLATNGETGQKSADLVVRVPVKDFETLMTAFAGLGTVVTKSVTGEDVTEKVSDATSDEQVLTDEVQIASKKLETARMSEKRTGQKEQELRQLRMQLAQTRARLGLLRKMATLSTINVSLSEKPKKPAAGATTSTGGFFHGMQETNRAAMQAFQTAVRVPLVLLMWTLAFSPIWVPLVIAYRWASLKTLAQKAVGGATNPRLPDAEG